MTFDEFVAQRMSALLRYAVVLTGDAHLAQDVVQEALARAHPRWSGICRLEVPELYVRKMILNEFLSWRRRWARVVPVAEVLDPGDASTATPDAAATHAERDALLPELARLPRRQRAVLVLRYYEDLSDGEIAERLGCHPGTVRGYASRALQALRVRVADGESARTGRNR